MRFCCTAMSNLGTEQVTARKGLFYQYYQTTHQYLTLGEWIIQKYISCLPPLDPDLISGAGMWQSYGHQSKAGFFFQILLFPPPSMTTRCQHFKARRVMVTNPRLGFFFPNTLVSTTIYDYKMSTFQGPYAGGVCGYKSISLFVQITSKSCSFLLQTHFTPLILAPKLALT